MSLRRGEVVLEGGGQGLTKVNLQRFFFKGCLLVEGFGAGFDAPV